MKHLIGILVLVSMGSGTLFAQSRFEIAGDSKVSNSGDTFVHIISKDVSSTARLELGDDLTYKGGVAYNGLEDFMILRGTPVEGHLMMNTAGNIGLNEEPGSARLFIKQNSGSGYGGVSQIRLEESETSGQSVIKFTNDGSSEAWSMAARADENGGSLIMTKHEDSDATDFFTLDGANFMVGIHQNSPEAYLHLKQQFAGVDALAFEEPNSQGPDKWSFRVGSTDILIYFNEGIRGGFDAQTGNYNDFPPSSSVPEKDKSRVSRNGNIWEIEPQIISSQNDVKFTYDLSSVSQSNALVSNDKGVKGYKPAKVAKATFEAFLDLQKLTQKREREINARLQALTVFKERVARLEKLNKQNP